MLPREGRLRSNRAFRQLYREGRSWAHPAAVLYTKPQDPPARQIGVSASRKLGNAVVRNRIRRRVMAVCRQLAPHVRPGIHLAFIVRAPALAMSPLELRAGLETLLRRAGALVEPGSPAAEPGIYQWPPGSGRPARNAGTEGAS
jgi:ribonuclease P protein component